MPLISCLRPIRRVSSLLALSFFISNAARAEIYLLEADPGGDSFYSPMSFAVGGSIRPRLRNDMGKQDNHAFWRRGYDGGTRFRFTGKYQFTPDLNAIAYWEEGMNIFKVAGMDKHYPEGTRAHHRRQLYGGFESENWGRLTYGRQDSVYYQTVGVKTDVWENDWHAKAAAVGVYSPYDGSDMPDRTLLYKLKRGPVSLYAMGYFPTHHYYTSSDWYFHRKQGAALGFDWRTTDDLTLSASYTRIKIKAYNEQTIQRDHEHIAAGSLAWSPGAWYFAVSGEYYGNFVPLTARHQPTQKFLAGDAYGATALVSRTFDINRGPLVNIAPYAAATRMKIVSGEHYRADQFYTGVNFQLRHGFRIAVEHTFSDSTDDLADSNWLDFYYDF